MSLFVPKEDMWDMPLGGVSPKKQIPHWVGNLCFVVIGFICKILFRYRVDNRKNLWGFQDKSGVVVVCNHTSYLDTVFVYLSSRPRQWTRLMAREELFSAAGGFLGRIFSYVGAFPVKRGEADRTAIKRATRMLKDNEVVGIFPEGTRRNKGSLEPNLNPGAAFIARMGKAPLLPMCVRNVDKVKQKNKFIRLPKVTIEYGNPILVSDFDFLPKEDRLDGCMWYVMRECVALWQECCAEDVDMKKWYPDSSDFTEMFAGRIIPTHTTTELVCKNTHDIVSEKEVPA